MTILPCMNDPIYYHAGGCEPFIQTSQGYQYVKTKAVAHLSVVKLVNLPCYEIMWNANLMQQGNFIDIGYIRPSSGALNVELQHMVFCTEFLDGWWS